MSINFAPYLLLATMHRPLAPQAIATEIRRLDAYGLTGYDIAAVMKIPTQ